MAFQSIHFLRSELEHEIRREAVSIPLRRLIENLGWNAIKFCQIRIEQDLFMAEPMNQRGNRFGRNDDGFRFFHSATSMKFLTALAIIFARWASTWEAVWF